MRLSLSRRLACLGWLVLASTGCGEVPPAPTHSVSGRVRGDVAAQVLVTLSGDRSASFTTYASGNYSFGGLSDGSYTLTAYRAGFRFLPRQLTVTLSRRDLVRLDFSSCDVRNWCEEPTPASTGAANLNGIWGAGPGDVWVVGSLGTTLHWDGETWSSVPSDTGGTLQGVWGSGPDDVWIVGVAGILLHWNGSAWSSVPSGSNVPLQAVWGSGPSDVWALEQFGTSIHHWDGKVWATQDLGTYSQMNAVWGSGPSDVWVVGRDAVLHWDGEAWGTVLDDPLDPPRMNAAWGSGANDVWAVGDSGRILRWDGSVWSAVASPAIESLHAVHGSGPDDVWAGGESGIFHWNGSVWSQSAGSGTFDTFALWGGPSDVWALTYSRIARHPP